jgi:hypothetical protein
MLGHVFFPRRLIRFALIGFVCFGSAGVLSAQSLDQNTPAPIRSTSLIGKIAARDLGDSRLTDHYYAFNGTPGDLLITVQSRNLNGDLDVFTAGTLRPLLKLTLYAENSRPVTKGIYLRRRESLILRIEARSPNDDEGSYQLFFSGSFEPIVGGPDIAEVETTDTGSTTTSTGGRKPKRVTSVGARINEPEPPVTEVAATPTPEPTPEVKVEEPKPKVETPRTPPGRNARNRPPTSRRNTPVRTTPPKKTETVEEKQEESTAKTETTEPEPKPKAPARNTRRGATAKTTTPKPPPEPEPETGPRLVIETNDGTLINRSMSGVRRVTVENGQVVVTGKDGKIDRILLANIVRMSIAP